MNGPDPRGSTQDPRGSTQDNATGARRLPRRLPRRIERRIALSRLMLVWEALWPALWPAAGLSGLFLAMALFGVFSDLPMGPHWVLLGIYGGLVAWMLWRGLRGFGWPGREAALRRLEEASGLTHQPLAAYEDLPAEGTGSPALWAAHQRWVSARLLKLRMGLPSPGLASRDPYALRAIIVLLLVIAFAGTGPGRAARVAEALLPGIAARKALTLEAWITPPAYTGIAPLYLARSGEPGEPDAQASLLKVPVNSVLSLRVHGLRTAPALEISTTADRGRPHALKDMGGSNYAIDAPLTAPAELALTQGGRLIRGWKIETITDRAPAIAFTRPLERTATGSLRFAYSIDDDYGVVAAEARIALAAPPPAFPAGRGGKTPALRPHVAPPSISLPLPSLRPREAEAETYVDLTPHPWAGLPVTITLVARDDAGQEGASAPVPLTLPARNFSKPLAMAVVEQRRALALDPAALGTVARYLDDFTRDSERYIEDKRIYLALRAAYWRLASARRDSDLTGIFDLLWSTALAIEDGERSIAEADVRRARDALAEALARDADSKEIEQLMAGLRDAFNRYMEALAAQAPVPGSGMDRRFAPADGQTIDRQDLENMLKMIGELARTGARDQAKAMLSQLQAIMENMQVPQSGGGMTPGEQAMAGAIDRMGKLIDRQRQLMDETFRQRPPAATESAPGGQPVPGEGSRSGAEGGSGRHGAMQSLKRSQEDLRDELARIIREIEQAGQKPPASLGQAGEAMESAGKRLDAERAERAAASQGQAIAHMRDGAQALADQLMQSMAGRMGSSRGKNGSRSDPLGRPAAESGPDSGADVAIPDKIDIQRAREILDELRRRASELGRPQIELDYLDRLLKRF